MSETRKRTHFCPRAIEHGIGVCQTETCGECPLALPEFAATPPTPDLAAVVARQRLDRIYEATAEGEYDVSAYCEARDALLAAVSRPAEARGEPVAWGVVDSKGTMCWAEAEKTRKLMAHLAWCDETFPEDAPHTLVPLYAHPAPSGGEVEKWHRSDCDSKVMGEDACDSWCGAAKCRTRPIAAAPRPETGDT